MVLELCAAESAEVLSEFSKCVCGIDKDVDPIRWGFCNWFEDLPGSYILTLSLIRKPIFGSKSGSPVPIFGGIICLRVHKKLSILGVVEN